VTGKPALRVAEGRRLPAPSHLSRSSRAVWAEILGGWELEAHELALLERALTALDRAEEARRLVEAHGPLIEGR
jgi:hypothetical protein